VHSFVKQNCAAKRVRIRAARWICVGGCCVLLVLLPLKNALAQTNELAGISTLVEQGKLEEAEQRLHRYLEKLPRSAKANTLLGEVYLREGHFTEAESALQKAVAAAPASVVPRLTLGDVLVAEAKLDSAIAAYQEAAKVSPHDVRANLALSKLYLGSGEFQKSIEAAGNIPMAKRTEELLPTLAADYFGLRQPEKASLEIEAMLKVADKQPDLIPELAEFFIDHRDFKSSQELLTLAKDKQPTTERLQIDQARTQAGLGKLDEAQSTLEGVLQRAPRSVDALVAAGQVATLQKEWAAAAEAFTLAGQIAPDRPDILAGLISAQLYGGRPNDALVNAQKLHALVPDDLRATYLLALATFGGRQWQDAKRFAEMVLQAHPDDREMNLILVEVAFNDEHNLVLARKHLDVCLKQNPNDPGALYYLGMIQKMDGDTVAAIQTLSKSVALNPKNGDAQGALGALLLQSGDVTRAITALELAKQASPDEAQNYYNLALAYSRAGEADKAKAHLERYQQMKAKEAKDSKGPSTSEVHPTGMGSQPQ
jgi:tetratricopeptide (TPR) repeat protein